MERVAGKIPPLQPFNQKTTREVHGLRGWYDPGVGTRAPSLMVQGPGSRVGKRLLVTALCRLFARAGYRVAMNPILLKPEADDLSQVVVRGVAEGRFAYREYAGMRSRLVEVVPESLERLRAAPGRRPCGPRSC
jgi:hypothetical protein